MSEEKKEIEVIKGDGKDLTISTVYDHVKKDNSYINEKRKEDVVIPKSSKETDKNKQE